MRTKRLGDMLVEMNLLSEEQLQDALKVQRAEKERLGTTLVTHGYITESQMVDALRMQLGIDYIDLTKTDISPEMSQYIPKTLAKKEKIIPVSVSKDTLFLAMADPTNFMALEQAQKASHKRIIPMIDEVYEAFLEEYEIQRCLVDKIEVIDGYTNFVFTTANGTVFLPQEINRAIKNIYEAYNKEETQLAKEKNREPILLPHFSAHHLRHTFCTRFCENETNLKVI